jgi:hypothetical protein
MMQNFTLAKAQRRKERKEVLNDMNANIKYFDFLIFALLAPLRENDIAATG